jgi:hypothetical protein
MIQTKTHKIPITYVCDVCGVNTCKKGDYSRHILTAKHKMLKNAPKCFTENTEYNCECGKRYKHRPSYNRHKKLCDNADNANNTEKTNANNTEKTNDKNLIFKLVAQNQELMNLLTNQKEETKTLVDTIKEIIPKIGTTNNTTNSTTNHNKFNLNIFLSEDCKDAINFSDFIKNIQVSPDVLENQTEA